MTEDLKRKVFIERIARDEKIEADDWMPEDYRKYLVRLISMHAISEIMGALPEKEWVPKAPTLHRKLAIMAKVQDEMGHGQLLLRVTEDLIAPWGQTRDHLLQDLFSGKLRFHNVFHMEAPTWADAGVIAWLVDGAAIITQSMSLSTSYAPYARALQRICAEEVFHAQHGESIILSLAEGTPQQRDMLQDAITRWWPSLLMFFGPKEADQEAARQKSLEFKIRNKTNEELRQIFFSKYVPKIWALGLTIPDETLAFDDSTRQWTYQQPDWNEFKQIIDGNGPRSKERLQLRKISYEEAKWVRSVILSESKAVV